MTTEFDKILARHKRIAIVGGPRTGKTTLVEEVMGRRIIHTDDFMDLEWKEVPDAIIEEVELLDDFVVEGVQAARALRKGMEVDAVVFISEPKVQLTTRQAALGKSVLKWFIDWMARESPGVEVVYFLDDPPTEWSCTGIVPAEDQTDNAIALKVVEVFSDD